jgi:hypothetical protein
MAGLSQDKPVLSGEILRFPDEPLTDSDWQSSVSGLDFAQEKVLIQEAVIMNKIVMITMNVHVLPDSEVQWAWKQTDNKFRNN